MFAQSPPECFNWLLVHTALVATAASNIMGSCVTGLSVPLDFPALPCRVRCSFVFAAGGGTL